LLPKDLLKDEETVITPLFARIYQFHAMTTSGSESGDGGIIPTVVNELIDYHTEESLQSIAILVSNIFVIRNIICYQNFRVSVFRAAL
jgi:hypothetical protein